MSSLESLTKAIAKENKKLTVKTSLIDDRFKLLTDFSKMPLTGREFLSVKFDVFTSSSIATCTIGELVDAALRQQIFRYPHNRGSGILKDAWVLEKSEKFYVDGFGTVALVDMGHNRYKINEGHYRIQTLLYMRQTGQLKKFENVVIPVQILRDADQFMEVYRATNANHGHTVTDKLTNSDYGYGREINSFLNVVDTYTYRGIKIVSREHIKQVALLLFGTTIKDPSSVSFKEFLNNTKQVTELADLLPEEFTLRFSQNNKTELKRAFNFTIDVMKEVINLTDLNGGRSVKAKLSNIGKNILNSAMFFSLLTWDRYSDSGNLTAIDYKQIARKLVAKADWTNPNLSLLSSKKSMDDAVDAFYGIIRTRKQN